MMRATCRACGTASVEIVLDAGALPVCNRFASGPSGDDDRYELALGQCRACGLVQLQTTMPVDALVPRVDWVTYNEPEGHLDAVVDTLTALPGLSADATLGAMTYKDDSTLARLANNGWTRQWRVDAVAELGLGPTAGLETIQDRFTPAAAARLAESRTPADLLLVRHILEHAYDTRRFLEALRALVRPGGYMVFEVPDCTQVLETLDYTTLWEEHVLYFTPATLRSTLERSGFEIVDFAVHPYPYENSLVAVVRPIAVDRPVVSPVDLDAELARIDRFAAGFADRRSQVQRHLRAHRASGGRIAVFGAGHLSCMFINLMAVSDAIAFVVDDHPAKRGMFMPGSRLSIRPSDALIGERIDLCLSSLSPESEEKVVARQAAFIAQGGRFVSVFPSSRRAMMLPQGGG